MAYLVITLEHERDSLITAIQPCHHIALTNVCMHGLAADVNTEVLLRAYIMFDDCVWSDSCPAYCHVRCTPASLAATLQPR